MSKLDYSRLRYAGKTLERVKDKPVQGCNTNIRRQPVKVFTDAEKAEWLKGLGLSLK